MPPTHGMALRARDLHLPLASRVAPAAQAHTHTNTHKHTACNWLHRRRHCLHNLRERERERERAREREREREREAAESTGLSAQAEEVLRRIPKP
jgi:hypothetical protein